MQETLHPAPAHLAVRRLAGFGQFQSTGGDDRTEARLPERDGRIRRGGREARPANLNTKNYNSEDFNGLIVKTL